MHPFFQGRKMVIATMHAKDEVLAPLLESALGVTCVQPGNLNTDLLGTFSGEVERELDPLETARKKALMALEKQDAELAIASEGSFGAHPQMFFVSSDEELLYIFDRKHNLHFYTRHVSTDTNFAGKLVSSASELLRFADQAGFPSHGLIVKRSESDLRDMVKGIRDEQHLLEAWNQLGGNGQLYVETDMRAMHNPRRMNVIRETAEKLVKKLFSLCPSCSCPGFDAIAVKEKLPCGICGIPTRTPATLIYRCERCQYEELRPASEKKSEDPMYCDYCNP